MFNFWVLKTPRTLFRNFVRALLGLPVALEDNSSWLRRRLGVCWWNLRAPRATADCLSFLFGVGGSGRSPVESADPQVRRVGRPFETLLSATEQNGSLESCSGGRGAGVPMVQNSSKSPSEFRGALSYNHYFRLWAPGWLSLPSLKQFLTPKGTLWTHFETNFGSRKAIGDSFAGTSL